MEQYKQEFIEFMVEAGVLTFGDFVKGIHETGVWMMRPGHPPVPGALTFG